MAPSQEKMQLGTNCKMTQMLELAGKKLKAAIVTTFKDL